MVLPPSKRQKAPKKSLDSMSELFFIIPPSATSCTHRLTCRFGRCFCTLCRGLHRRPAPFTREAKRLICFYSARFSHFIDSLYKAITIDSLIFYHKNYRIRHIFQLSFTILQILINLLTKYLTSDIFLYIILCRYSNKSIKYPRRGRREGIK